VSELNNTSSPRVSIGVPVYNGENYLEEALDSLLAQTYDDFELIISDNASTDRTQEICRGYTAKDRRIRYFRNEANLGAAKNYNRVVELSCGEYFKWAAHDDVCAPEFLTRCVTVLERDASVVLCYTKMVDIDEEGKYLRETRTAAGGNSMRPYERFRGLMHWDHQCAEIFGVIRANILKKTPLIASFADCDRVLLAEISLYGCFYQVPEVQFFHRLHRKSSVRMYPGRVARSEWFDPALAARTMFPRLRQFYEYLLVVKRGPLTLAERVFCYLAMGGWLKDNTVSLIWGSVPEWMRQWARKCRRALTLFCFRA
jgi:glycosyltransferase involved in cell wall biosynthesis